MVIGWVALSCSFCTSTNMTRYYSQHHGALDSMERSYKQLYGFSPFSVLYTDRSFQQVSLEIVTDSLKYIYEFGTQEPRLKDTLIRYHLPVEGIYSLMEAMRSIHCTWISNLDYYVDDKKNSLVYISIHARALRFPLKSKKYYILTYFPQPQYYDSEGRLLDHRQRRRLRKINGEIFHRINDRVCYTVSDLFR